MLRLIHSQTVQGAILVDDIDDGLPNKQIQRLQGDPDAYERDGYANKPKQACYIPRTDATDSSLAGYIDLNETQRVLMSAESGKIAGLQTGGLISVVSLLASDLDAPTVSSATLGSPAAGDLTVGGTKFLSTLPSITSARVFGDGVGDVTLTSAQIEAVPPGAVADTSVIIDSTLLAGLQGGDKVTITADGQTSDTFYLAPTISGTTLAGDITIDGIGFLSDSPSVTSVHLTGAGVGDVTLTSAQILAVPPGAVSNAQIIIDSTLVPSLASGDSVTVTADGQTSAASVI